MRYAEKHGHAFTIKTESADIIITYAEWLLIKAEMTEIIIKEVLE